MYYQEKVKLVEQSLGARQLELLKELLQALTLRQDARYLETLDERIAILFYNARKWFIRTGEREKEDGEEKRLDYEEYWERRMRKYRDFVENWPYDSGDGDADTMYAYQSFLISSFLGFHPGAMVDRIDSNDAARIEMYKGTDYNTNALEYEKHAQLQLEKIGMTFSIEQYMEYPPSDFVQIIHGVDSLLYYTLESLPNQPYRLIKINDYDGSGVADLSFIVERENVEKVVEILKKLFLDKYNYLNTELLYIPYELREEEEAEEEGYE